MVSVIRSLPVTARNGTLLALAVATLAVAGCAAPRERSSAPMTRAEFMQSRTPAAPSTQATDAATVEALAPAPAPDTATAIAIPQPVESDLPVDVQPAPRATTPARTHPAALALLNEAMRQEKSGEYELAAAKLERALRIEPRSALLWNRLAKIRLQQGQHQLAANLAAKSNSYAPGDSELVELNQRIIAGSKKR
jgi:tetratricopeptide (TPR) repeat protein